MAEGGNNTIGRANVELGADTSKLSAGLKDAQKQTEQVVAKTEQQAKKAEDKAKSGSDGFGFGAAKAAALALVGAMQKLIQGIKEARSAGAEFAASMRSIEDAFRTDTSAGLDPFTRRREEIEKTKIALLEQIRIYEQQRNVVADLVALATNDAESEAKRAKIITEAAAAQERLVRTTEENAKKEREAATRKAQEDAASELRNSAARLRVARARMEEEAEIRVQVEQEANRKIEDDRRKRAEETSRQLMQSQQEQFAQLRNEINGLFNTNQLEIGINRLGALMEIMVQKIGDSR